MICEATQGKREENLSITYQVAGDARCDNINYREVGVSTG